LLDAMPWRQLLVLAGMGQLALAAGSLAIPRVLHWREETERLSPLTRQVFWTYAGYIWTSHVAFGLVSVVLPDALLGPGALAPCATGFIALWWGVRVVLQVCCFDRSARPPGALYALAESALMFAFVACALLYSILTLRHLYP
jgi:hypothetical protein